MTTNQKASRLIVFDVETVPTQNPRIKNRLIDEAVARRPAKSLRKDLKAAWDRDDARKERISKALTDTAKDPALAEPIVVVANCDGETLTWDRCDLSDDTLAQIRHDLDERLGPNTVIAGHNIETFDLPVLLNAWRRIRITPPTNFPVYSGRYWRGFTYDTLRRFPSKTPFESLEAACEAYGILGAKSVIWRDKPMHGSRVYDAWKAGEHDLLVEYCQRDVMVEHALYMAMTAQDSWGTYGTEDKVAQEVSQIEASDELTEGQKALLIYQLLDKHGRIPRAAA